METLPIMLLFYCGFLFINSDFFYSTVPLCYWTTAMLLSDTSDPIKTDDDHVLPDNVVL